MNDQPVRNIIITSGNSGIGRATAAASALYLASPEVSFVAGEVLNVNGGWLFGH